MAELNYFHLRVDAKKRSVWMNFKSESIAAINLYPLIDLTECNTREDLNERLGENRDTKKAHPKEMWKFKSAGVGDIIFANDDKDRCIGVGLITGEYAYTPQRDFKHRRKVKWVTDKEFTFIAPRYPDLKIQQLFLEDLFDAMKPERAMFLLGEYVKKYSDLKEKFEAINITIPDAEVAPVVAEAPLAVAVA